MFVQRPKHKPLLSLSHSVLLTIGFFLTAVGTVGTSVIQGGILHLDQYTDTAALGQLVQIGTPEFTTVTWAMVCLLISGLALPIYGLLLVEGVRRTGSFRNYLLRMLLFACLAEAPFDLAYSGKWFDLSGQNPLFGFCICLIMLYLFQKLDTAYADSKSGRVQLWLLKACILVGAGFWVILSQSLLGIYFVALTAIFWFFGAVDAYDNIYTLLAATVACLLRFPAPFGLLFVHWYDAGKGRGKAPRFLFYGLYLVLLLVCGAARQLFA